MALIVAVLAAMLGGAALTVALDRPAPVVQRIVAPAPAAPRGVCVTSMEYDGPTTIVTGVYQPVVRDGVMACATGDFVSTVPIVQ